MQIYYTRVDLLSIQVTVLIIRALTYTPIPVPYNRTLVCCLLWNIDPNYSSITCMAFYTPHSFLGTCRYPLVWRLHFWVNRFEILRFKSTLWNCVLCVCGIRKWLPTVLSWLATRAYCDTKMNTWINWKLEYKLRLIIEQNWQYIDIHTRSNTGKLHSLCTFIVKRLYMVWVF